MPRVQEEVSYITCSVARLVDRMVFPETRRNQGDAAFSRGREDAEKWYLPGSPFRGKHVGLKIPLPNGRVKQLFNGLHQGGIVEHHRGGGTGPPWGHDPVRPIAWLCGRAPNHPRPRIPGIPEVM